MLDLKLKTEKSTEIKHRDLAIIEMVSKGMTAKEISNISNIGTASIDLALANIRKQYGFLNTTHMVAEFIRRGIIPILIVGLFSCSPRITIGNVQAVSKDTVTLNTGRKFVIKGKPPVLGQFVTFAPTVNRGKINSKRL